MTFRNENSSKSFIANQKMEDKCNETELVPPLPFEQTPVDFLKISEMMEPLTA